MAKQSTRVQIGLATAEDREDIYRIRHAVYAREIGQHPENPQGTLRDSLDAFNVYLVAKVGRQIVGFISITPPSEAGFSIDKYFNRDEVPLAFDRGLYEVRLLTVVPDYRKRKIALLLMFAALRWVGSKGGNTLVAIGRLEVLDDYLQVGMRSLGKRVQSGRVRYELMTATVAELHRVVAANFEVVERMERMVDWRLAGVPFRESSACVHGGASIEVIGEQMDRLDKISTVINADVLDAWFPPAPRVLEVLGDHLHWVLRTSPPTRTEGLRKAIGEARGLASEALLCGAGSSDLIFLAFRHWLDERSRVLLLDPTYGEYPHVVENLIGCVVERLTLSRHSLYDVPPEALAERIERGYDWVVLVNPNSPTGRHMPRQQLEAVLAAAPPATRFWIDETYIDYAGPGQSLERLAAQSSNTVVCKSLSKVYALSGARCAYLCGPDYLLGPLRRLNPPWSVSLTAQIAAVIAVRETEYYARVHQETHRLRTELLRSLAEIAGVEAVPSVTNFLLFHLDPDGPDAEIVAERCRADGLYLRNVGSMGTQLGRHCLRVAVKDGPTNERMVEILKRALAAD
jgi:histidinol-phosphate/aromatic aminotransferase/cobyric acid decarboxylase-like protein/GNAT superfamily N-acetyltransferase